MIHRLSFPFKSIHFLLPPAIKSFKIFVKSSLDCLFSFLKSNILKHENEQTNVICTSSVLLPQNHPTGIVKLSEIYDTSFMILLFLLHFLCILTLALKKIDPISIFSSHACHWYLSHRIFFCIRWALREDTDDLQGRLFFKAVKLSLVNLHLTLQN